MPLEPFIKWAGGKRQLLPQITKRMPKEYRRYFEPFLGGGAMLLHFMPGSAVANDSNQALTHTYKAIRDDPEAVLGILDELDNKLDGKDYYLYARNLYNLKIQSGSFDARTAALFLFLNKHCFNGLYRVNKKGLFNVPYNKSMAPSANPGHIRAVSEYLKTVDIRTGDFAEACGDAAAGDFVFFDSPYAPLNPESFTAYTKDDFTLEDHRRLAELFRELDGRGCRCMLTNHDTELVRELYGGYVVETVPVKRFINSDASRRTGEEVIIRNYGKEMW